MTENGRMKWLKVNRKLKLKEIHKRMDKLKDRIKEKETDDEIKPHYGG